MLTKNLWVFDKLQRKEDLLKVSGHFFISMPCVLFLIFGFQIKFLFNDCWKLHLLLIKKKKTFGCFYNKKNFLSIQK